MAGPPIFLERQTYRARRMKDAMRLLVFLGFALWMVPLMWGIPGDGSEPMTMSGALKYLFTVWCLLVLAGWALYRQTPPVVDDAPAEESP